MEQRTGSKSGKEYVKAIYCHPACVIYMQSVVLVSVVQLFATPWIVAHQAPLSMEFSRQGYWSGLPFPSTGDLPDTGIEPRSPALQPKILYHLIHQSSRDTINKQIQGHSFHPWAQNYNDRKGVHNDRMKEMPGFHLDRRSTHTPFIYLQQLVYVFCPA